MEDYIPKPGDDKPIYIIGGILAVMTLLGGVLKIGEMNTEREKRKAKSIAR